MWAKNLSKKWKKFPSKNQNYNLKKILVEPIYVVPRPLQSSDRRVRDTRKKRFCRQKIRILEALTRYGNKPLNERDPLKKCQTECVWERETECVCERVWKREAMSKCEK